MKKLMVVLSAAMTAVAVFADTFTWKGGTGAFSSPDMWEEGAVPVEGADLVFPAKANVVTGIGTFTVGDIVLNGETDFRFGSDGGTFVVGGVVSGSGNFTSTGNSAAESVIDLRGENTFTGWYWNNGGKTIVRTNTAMGAGTVYLYSNGKPANTLETIGVTRIANNIEFEKNNKTYDGWMSSDREVEFAGKVTCQKGGGNWRVGGSFVFSGGFNWKASGSIIMANATFTFRDKPITDNGSLDFQFNNGHKVVFAVPGNAVRYIGYNRHGGTANAVVIDTDDPFAPGTELYCEDVSAVRTFDLNGHDVTLKASYRSYGANSSNYIKTDAPATLTLEGDTADRRTDQHFDGALSLVYDCGKTYTISHASTVIESTMSGTLRSKSGTVLIGANAKFTNLGRIRIDPLATVEVGADSAGVAAKVLEIARNGEDCGKLVVGAGKTLVFDYGMLDGTPMEARDYTASNEWLQLGEGAKVTIAGNLAGKYVWTGEAGGLWSARGNWLYEGVTPLAEELPADAPLYIGSSTAARPFTVYDPGKVAGTATTVTIPNPIELGGGYQVISNILSSAEDTAASYLCLTGKITGRGGIRAAFNDNHSYTQLDGDNSFEGGVLRDGAGQVRISQATGLGLGKFEALLPRHCYPARPLQVTTAGLAITNDLSFCSEAIGVGGKWGGYAGFLGNPGELHLLGKIEINGETRYSGDANASLYFDGDTVIKDRLTLNTSGAHFYFKKAVTGGGYLHTDQGQGHWHFLASGNQISRSEVSGASGSHSIVCGAPNVFPESFYEERNSGVTSAFNLGGFDQTIAKFTGSSTSHTACKITSDAMATFTLKPTANGTLQNAHLEGKVAFNYAPTGDYTLTSIGAVHSNIGDVTISKGTFKLQGGSTFSSLGNLNVAAGATLELAADATAFAGKTLKLADDTGMIVVPTGMKLTFDYGFVGNTALEARTYADGWVSGGGAVEIKMAMVADAYYWTGAADGDLANAANWLRNGAVPAAAPSFAAGSSDAIRIEMATSAHPIVIGANTVWDAPIELGSGDQYVVFAKDNVYLTINGKISGAGCLHCDSSAHGVRYVCDLKNTANDFTGGVTRGGAGQIKVYGTGVLGTGLLNLGDGGTGVNDGAPYNTPLYIAESCTIDNDIWVGHENRCGWNGWITSDAGKTVHFTGKATFRMSGVQTRYVSGVTVHFDGEFDNNGSHICKGGATVHFKNQIKGNGSLWADNGNFTGYLHASNNEVTELSYGGTGIWTWYLKAKDALVGANLYEYGASPNTVRIYLCGNDQHLKNLYYDQDETFNERFYIENLDPSVEGEVAPATLTLNATANHSFGGTFKGKLSLVYEPTGDYTYTLTQPFQTEGSLTVKGGTVKLANANMLTRKNDVVLDGGKLELDGDQIICNLTLGTGNPVDPGRYVSKDYSGEEPGVIRLEQLTGEGVLTVRGNPGLILFFK